MADFSSLSSRTIKVSHGEETRRGKLSVPAGASPAEAFAVTRTTVAALFETSVEIEALWLKYLDDEGDLCTLTEHSMADWSSLLPDGTLKLTLEIRGAASHEAKSSNKSSSDPAPQDGACQATAADHPHVQSTDDALRSTIRSLLQKIPAGVRGLALNVVQSMDPSALHGMARTFSEQKAAHAGQFTAHFGEEAQQRMNEVDEVLPQLLSVEPEALKALIMEELRELNADAGAETSGAQQTNPFEAMLGALLGGNSMQANGAAPQDHLGEMMRTISGAGKGMGKGAGVPQAGSPGGNPWEAIFAGKGVGKGAGIPQQGAPGINLWEGHAMNTGPESRTPVTEAAPASRATFEDGVADLMSMGLVTDPQVARELLTEHGDVSTVVAILTMD